MYSTVGLFSVLSGVPKAKDTGNLFLLVSVNEKEPLDTIDIHVHDEVKNPCKDATTYWLELYFNSSFDRLTTEQLEIMVEQAVKILKADR